ncbi:SURF1 family protein [Allohahella marinimesophila]|uniref:SURF1-like protein n=1 Tax=Allohahella marinimesophila TaxID=1054972 RepID=A0ABP7PCT9_9GAMM
MSPLIGILRQHWKILLFAGFFTPLFIYLGLWQLSRSDEKADLMSRLEAGSEAEPRLFDWQSSDRPEGFTRLRIKGEFLPDRQVLYDNQIFQGAFGYRVFTPFCDPETQSCLLVERGWVPGDARRSTLPSAEALSVPEGLVEIVGQADTLQAAPLIMENTEANARKAQWPRRVQMMVDPPALLEGFADSAFLADRPASPSVLPWVLRMAPESPGGLQPFWTPNVMSAAKHTGYALQWFAMAIALMALTVWQLARRGDDDTYPQNLEQKHDR